MWRKLPLVIFILIAPVLIGLGLKFVWNDDHNLDTGRPVPPVGAVIDRFHGVTIHFNGEDSDATHGKHFCNKGKYYFGERWLSVEFVKRYYFSRFKHLMPNVWGDAKTYYDASVAHGGLNAERALLQYDNGGSEKPRPDDILVYVDGKCGHVAIISEVSEDHVEIVQQNVFGKPRVSLPLSKTETGWLIGTDRMPAGWLRLPQRPVSSN